MQTIIATLFLALAMMSCSAKGGRAETEAAVTEADGAAPVAVFSADSAYSYVKRQVDFGPRVPGSEAHARAGKWLASELERHGALVTLQEAQLKAFDGTMLPARNIFGQYNPGSADRLLLVAHWDSRPWADKDPDPAKRKTPVDGANDGASGVGVLLEVARQLATNAPAKGVDILFVDAEDWGDDGDEDSWALGAKYFVDNPVKPGYKPSEVIVLDMVGGADARFPREYFSQQNAPQLLDRIYAVAAASGYAPMFPNEIGGAVTDDHVQFIRGGIPAVDIIDYRDGFHPAWHTSADDMTTIDRRTLGAVGQTIVNLILGFRDK